MEKKMKFSFALHAAGSVLPVDFMISLQKIVIIFP